MKEEDKLHQKYGSDPGFKVPDGYFDGFYSKMKENLPEYPAKPVVPELTRWQRMKPYIYLAAMFCGIWCMMKIFSDISTRVSGAQDAVPEGVVLAMSDSETADYFVDMEDEESDIYIEEQVSAAYDNMADFESDFDYTLAPEYANIEIRG